MNNNRESVTSGRRGVLANPSSFKGDGVPEAIDPSEDSTARIDLAEEPERITESSRMYVLAALDFSVQEHLNELSLPKNPLKGVEEDSIADYFRGEFDMPTFSGKINMLSEKNRAGITLARQIVRHLLEVWHQKFQARLIDEGGLTRALEAMIPPYFDLGVSRDSLIDVIESERSREPGVLNNDQALKKLPSYESNAHS